MTTPSKPDAGAEELPKKLEINEEYSFVAYPDGRIALDGSVGYLERELVRRYNLCPKLAESLREIAYGRGLGWENAPRIAKAALAEHDQARQE